MAFTEGTAFYKKPAYLATFTILACIQVILSASTLYGYASLLVIFKELKLYHEKCGDGIAGALNSTITGDVTNQMSCQEQDKALNLPYAIGIVAQSMVKIPLGIVVDKLGAKSCQYIGSMFMIFFGFSLAYVEPGKEYLMFIAFIFLAFGSSFLLLSPFQVTNILYTTKKAFFLSLLSGCIDGSTVIFILFLEIFEVNIKFPTICISYAVGTAIFIMLITHFLYPSQQILQRLVDEDIMKMMRPEDSECTEESTLLKMRSEDFSASYTSSYQMYHEAIHKSLELLKETERREALLSSLSHNMAIQYSQSFHQGSFARSYQSSTHVGMKPYGTIKENVAGFAHDTHTSTSYFDNKQGMRKDDKVPLIVTESSFKKSKPKLLTPYSGDKFCDYYFSKLNLFCTYTGAVILLKTVHFIGSLDKYLLIMTDFDTATSYIKTFGYIQFCACFAAPICSLLFINKRKGATRISAEEEYFLKIKELIFPSFVFFAVIFLLDLMQLFEILKVSYFIFVLYLFGNTLLWCYISLFYAYLFPAQYYCTLFGICCGISGACTFFQYPLLYLEQDVFGGNQYYINVIFLCAIISTFILPIYLVYYYKMYKPVTTAETYVEEEEKISGL